MARTTKKAERAKTRASRATGGIEDRERTTKEWSPDDLMGMVCNLVCEGRPVSDIKKQLEEKHHIEISREEPYRLVSRAASRGYLRYVAPKAYDLAGRMREQYKFLKDVSVIRTASATDISFQVAQTILEMMKEKRRPATVSIAFAGGSLLRLTAKWLSTLLVDMEPDELPRHLVLLALSAGLDYRDMTGQPNALFTYFSEDHHFPLKVSFVGLPAPGLVTEKQMNDLISNYSDIRKAFEHKDKIDIFVTSAGGCWPLGHSALYSIYSQSSPKSLKQLNAAGCIGDVMWLPFGEKGPLDISTEMRIMTLVELSDLPRFIENKKSVILSIAPCGQCGKNKSELLRAILASEPPLITHLIADSRSVGSILPKR